MKPSRKQHPYLRKRSSQLWVQFSPDLHERHGSKRCSMGRLNAQTHTAASPWIPEFDGFFHVLLRVVVFTSLLVNFQTGCSLARLQSLSGSTHTSASTSCTLRATNPHIRPMLLRPTETQPRLKWASCYASTVRYLHRSLRHNDCELAPRCSKRWLESARAAEGRGEVGRKGRGRSFQEMMLLLVSDSSYWQSGPFYCTWCNSTAFVV